MMFNSRNHFHLTLPSNVSMNIYLNNMAAQYMTKLPKCIELTDGDWSVSLKEISMPISFLNVQSNQYLFQVKSKRNTWNCCCPVVCTGPH